MKFLRPSQSRVFTWAALRWGAVLGGISFFASAAFAQPPAPSQPAGAIPAAPRQGGDATRPHFVIRADKGFLDDPFAIDPAAAELAVLLTDSASFARVDVIDLKTGKPKRTIPLGDPQAIFEKVLLVPGGKGCVVLQRDPGKGLRFVQQYDQNGKASGLFGPVTEVAMVSRAGSPILVAMTRGTNPTGDSTYSLSQHRIDGLGRIGKAVTVAVTKDSVLKMAPLKVHGWQAGWTQLIGQQPGGFDKKKDMRLPDRAAAFDPFERKFIWEMDIPDLTAWAAIAALRPKRPGRVLLGMLADNQKSVEVVEPLGRRARLDLSVPFDLYDPSSFQDEESDDLSTLHFSLGVDPLNARALDRKKRDRAFLDLYVARADRPVLPPGKEAPRFTTTRLLRAALDERPVSWRVQGQTVAVLRKHKSFSRGGNELEVYALPTP